MTTQEFLVKNEIKKSIDKFANASSLHGVKYICGSNSKLKDRFIWLVALVLCVFFAVGVGSYLWDRYRMVPTVIDVKDTHQPLYTFPFPTITVCSGIRVKRSTARQILSRYLPSEIPLKTKENIMLYVMSLLSLLQFPNYNLLRPYLRTGEVKQLLHLFMDLNITDFMLQVMPRCDQVFYECSWHGSMIDCCDLFTLQRTEEGFCWSFNSLTSEDRLNCPLQEVLENEGVVEDDGIQWPECDLRRNTGISTGSGLELYLKPSDPSDNIGYRAQRVVNGVSILLHTSYEFPSAGTGVYAANIQGAHMSLAVTAELTRSSESIRSLPVEARNCIFPDENKLRIHHVYTQSSCLTECRLRHVMLMCGCKLYFFDIPDVRVSDCGVLHLACIAKISDKFRFYRPPVGTPGITSRELSESLSCDCRPTCYDTVYDVHIQRLIPEEPQNNSRYAHVDIYYSKTGFVRYQRYIVFEFIDLIVALGGVANLFLGFSLLSVVETIYWIYKMISAVVRANHFQRNVTKVSPLFYVE